MKRWMGCLATVGMIATFGVVSAAGQQGQRPGTVIVPPTNSERPEDVGVRAHTNFLIFVPAAGKPGPAATNQSPSGETPQSLSCVYQTWAGQVSGCPVGGSGYNSLSGGSNVIAIVDAYDYPTACSDFNTFSSQFGLPQANCNNNGSDPVFDVVYASGSKPRANCGWAQEEALDIEWAHAMAPNAKIILVEAATNSNSDLLTAIQKANSLIASSGGEVSMSWGGSEFSAESSYDGTYFSAPGVTYFASSGDSGGKVIWPSASANVISAGGTSVNRPGGTFMGESAWSSGGGGPSKYVTAPLYQDVVSSVWSSGYRGTPDISFDADPYTGVSVYDSTSCQGYVDWMVFGGTSVASPSLAGIANASGAFSGGWDSGSNGNSTADSLYNNYNSTSSGGTACNYSSPFYDVTLGAAGTYSATGCWDYATGIGTDRGLTGFAGGSNSGSAPAAPTNLTATAGDAQVSLSWTASSGAADYVVLRSTGGSSYSQIADVTSTSYTDTGLTNGTTYSYEVEAHNNYGTSAPSSAVSATPTASTGTFTVSASPSSQSLSPGGSTSFAVTISSSGFTGSVSLSVSGLPKFVSGSFSPNPVSVSTNGGSSFLTITANKHAGSSAGIYTLTIVGTSGSSSSSVTVSLTVNP